MSLDKLRLPGAKEAIFVLTALGASACGASEQAQDSKAKQPLLSCVGVVIDRGTGRAEVTMALGNDKQQTMPGNAFLDIKLRNNPAVQSASLSPEGVATFSYLPRARKIDSVSVDILQASEDDASIPCDTVSIVD